MQAVTAYADHIRFGSLPHAGGTFDQPGWLLEEMRIVHGVYTTERQRIEKRRAEAAKKPRRSAA